MYYKDLPASDILEEQRLDFRLPDFTKKLWASGETRQYWPEKVTQASNAWVTIEKIAFQEGVKDSILTFASKDEIPELKKWCKKVGGELILLQPARINNNYSSYGGGGNGESNGFRIAITRKQFVGDWYDAWNDYDGVNNRTIGKLLGYPDCCIDFFEKYWVDEEWIDLTYPAYVNSNNDASGPVESNILGRWMGIRWVSHMPCSFRCEHSVKIGKQNREIAKKFGYSEEADIIDEVLSWATRWSALHGIMELKTPVYKIAAGTDSTPNELVVERKGKQPEKAASGLGFPFNNKMPRSYTEGKRFENSLDAVYEADLWEDNGFSTKEGMRKSHEPIINIVGDVDGKVIDYGCGNGLLLEQIRMNNRGQCKCVGIETNSDVVDRAKDRFDSITFYTEDMFDFEPSDSYHTSILMIGRLTETTGKKREKFIKNLLNSSKFLVLYMYGDWITKHDSVDNLVSNFLDKSKLVLLDNVEKDNVNVAKYQVL